MDRSDLEHVEITNLSSEQRDLLEIYLEQAAIPYELSSDTISVPDDRARDLYAALSIVVRARPSGESAGDDPADVSPTERPPIIKRRPVVAGGRIVASRARRIVGAVIDWLSLLLWALAANLADAPSWAIAATLGLYVVVATAVFGRTLGKFAVGTVVVAHRTGELPGWLRSLLRWLVTSWFAVVTLVQHDLPTAVEIAAFGVLVLTYAPAWWDREGRGWHDRAADTVVVLAKQRARKPGTGIR